MREYAVAMPDTDPQIRVRMAETSEAYCIEILLGSNRVVLHTRSAIDLHQKLGKAICDWIGEATMELIELKMKERP